MRFAVLAAVDSWYLQDLRRAAGRRHEIVGVPFSQLTADVQGGTLRVSTAGQALEAFDAVLVRTMPPGSLEQVVFRMDALNRLEADGMVVVNSPRAVETAVDKFLATAKLQAAGLLVPHTCVCQTADEALQGFERLGGDVVVKPLFGSEGRGITRLNDENLALRAFRMLEQLGAVIYLQQFIPHEGCDLRLFVLGKEIWGMRRRNPLDWRTNVSRGATTERLEVTDELAIQARLAAQAVGAVIAGVDLLPGRDGRLYALEVNAVPGWKALARTIDVDVASRVLEYVASLVTPRHDR